MSAQEAGTVPIHHMTFQEKIFDQLTLMRKDMTDYLSESRREQQQSTTELKAEMSRMRGEMNEKFGKLINQEDFNGYKRAQAEDLKVIRADIVQLQSTDTHVQRELQDLTKKVRNEKQFVQDVEDVIKDFINNEDGRDMVFKIVSKARMEVEKNQMHKVNYWKQVGIPFLVSAFIFLGGEKVYSLLTNTNQKPTVQTEVTQPAGQVDRRK